MGENRHVGENQNGRNDQPQRRRTHASEHALNDRIVFPLLE
ncbi:hypothetical protein SDC9_177696 [bioreactor metagenome]|uniref:Uncharacterized protein n=1 Tax=bioreactor metagenome TaxID=1076179 RepID=A0A645H314_9ZZZZ